MRSNRTTGLTEREFDELVDRLSQRVVWNRGIGRPRRLTLPQATKAVLMYFKNNVTEEVIAELMLVDQSTISRAISELEPVIAEVLEEFIPDLDQERLGRVVVVDGSLCPCWSWAHAPQLWSGKHKTTGHSALFVCDLDGDLLHITDPLPGKTHDAKAVQDTGLSDTLGPEDSIADKGFIGTGPTTPIRKPQFRELLDWEHEFNTDINKIRYVIERTIAHFKTWRCMFNDYRRPLHTYKTAFCAVRALHFFRTSSA